MLTVEPNIEELSGKLAGKLNLTNIEAAQAEADVIVLLVDHKELRTMSKTALSKKALVDTRGVIESCMKPC